MHYIHGFVVLRARTRTCEQGDTRITRNSLLVRRIDILLRSNTRSKKLFALRLIFLLSFDSQVHASGCQKLPFELKRQRGLMTIIIRHKQTNWLALPVLVKSKTGNGIFLVQFGPHMTLIIRLASTREWLSETGNSKGSRSLFC